MSLEVYGLSKCVCQFLASLMYNVNVDNANLYNCIKRGKVSVRTYVRTAVTVGVASE